MSDNLIFNDPDTGYPYPFKKFYDDKGRGFMKARYNAANCAGSTTARVLTKGEPVFLKYNATDDCLDITNLDDHYLQSFIGVMTCAPVYTTDEGKFFDVQVEGYCDDCDVGVTTTGKVTAQDFLRVVVDQSTGVMQAGTANETIPQKCLCLEGTATTPTAYTVAQALEGIASGGASGTSDSIKVYLFGRPAGHTTQA